LADCTNHLCGCEYLILLNMNFLQVRIGTDDIHTTQIIHLQRLPGAIREMIEIEKKPHIMTEPKIPAGVIEYLRSAQHKPPISDTSSFLAAVLAVTDFQNHPALRPCIQTWLT